MSSQASLTLDDILLPLAITVIIDSKIKEPELNAFIEQGVGLSDLFELSGITDKVVREWYEENSEPLREKLSGKRRNTLVLRALTRFQDEMRIDNVFEAMVSISVSDHEYHEEESELIRSAASVWGLQRPPLKVDTRKKKAPL